MTRIVFHPARVAIRLVALGTVGLVVGGLIRKIGLDHTRAGHFMLVAAITVPILLVSLGFDIYMPFFEKRLAPFSRRLVSNPPVNAEFIFYLFMTPANCDALVGDLEERYALILRKFGAHRANFWYWTQAIRSLGPIAWAWAKNAVLKPVVAVVVWGIARGLIGHDSWLAALVEVWKRLRS